MNISPIKSSNIKNYCINNNSIKAWVNGSVIILLLIGGLWGLSAGTNGFSVWTAESARRLAALTKPTSLPAIRAINHQGDVHDLFNTDTPIVLLDFIYTRCLTVCQAMGYQFMQLQSVLQQQDLADKVSLLSVTFDNQYDNPTTLTGYLTRFHANTQRWQAAKIVETSSLKALLKRLGVIVLPDGQGGFVHNAAFYVVHNHQLVGIYDENDQSGLVEALWKHSQSLAL